MTYLYMLLFVLNHQQSILTKTPNINININFKTQMDITILVLYFSIFIISYILTQKLLHKLQNLPPSPFPTLPILGHLHLLKNPSNIHRTFSNISRKFGPVVHLQLGSRRSILVSSAQAAEECLNTNDTIFANRPTIIGSKIVGYGRTTMIWSPYGPLWRAHRKVASTEILSPNRVNSLSGIRADEVKSLVRRIYTVGEHHVVELKVAVMELTNNIMMRVIAGKTIFGDKTESKDAKRFQEMVKALFNTDAFCATDIFPFLKYFGMKKLAEKRFRAVFAIMDGFFQDLVDEQRVKMGEEGSESDGDFGMNGKNLIRVLLELQKRDPEYSTDDIIKGLVQNLLLAGIETSASTMEWALALLLNNPQVLKRAKQEIDDHVGKDRLMEESDLVHLPYLHCIINETLRMYPPAPLLVPHQSSSDCMVGGYHIPKGTMLNLNIWAIQNDPKLWDEPSKFKPERFEGVKGDRVGYKFMPFGSGRRACPGENLAMKVVGLTLGSLIQCFDLQSVGEIDMEEKVSINMWKANPLQAKFSAYKDMVELITRI